MTWSGSERRSLAAVGLVGALIVGPAAVAGAQDRRLDSLAALHEACRASDAGQNDVLYSIVLDGPVQLDPTEGDEEGETIYALHDGRQLRALGGSAQLVPANLEPIGFVANAERARALEVARARGARVRLGFFLGFDDPQRRACLVRPPQSVTAVRADVAFVELLDADGSVVAREDNDRLRAWNDDPDRRAAPEPQAIVGGPTIGPSPAPDAWARAWRAPPVARALVACHVAGVARGAAREAMVQVRLRVDGRTGRVEDGVIEVGNVGDEEETTCVLRTVRGAELPAGGAPGPVDVRIPIQLRAP
jgi:hypothetical protein